MSEDLLKKLISLMIEASNMKGMRGMDKKAFVMNKLEEHMKLDNALEDFILHIIDLLIDVDKGKLTFNKRAVKRVRNIFMCC
jgi:hypothetical protein